MKILLSIFSVLFILGCTGYRNHNNKVDSNSDFYTYNNSLSTNNAPSTYPKMREATIPRTRLGASHGSYYRPINMSQPVYVRGYFRKDGSYVRPHTRSYRRR